MLHGEGVDAGSDAVEPEATARVRRCECRLANERDACIANRLSAEPIKGDASDGHELSRRLSGRTVRRDCDKNDGERAAKRCHVPPQVEGVVADTTVCNYRPGGKTPTARFR